MNALVMYDHQTDTLWSQFLSRGVKGPLADTQLDIVPALQTTWEQWLSLHPETLVLDKKGRFFPIATRGTTGAARRASWGNPMKMNDCPAKTS